MSGWMKHAIVAAALFVVSCAPPTQERRALPQTSTPAPVVQETEAKPPIGTIPADLPKVKVAILLPLSGESSAVGQAMLDAATMALYDSYFSAPPGKVKSQVILIPKDSGITPRDGLRAAKQAMDQGATFIIGPLFSQSVAAIAPEAKKRGVSMLTFSNNRQVAQPGVYTFGFLPEQQVARMAEYTFLKNYTHVAVLAPNDTYGLKIQDSLVPAFVQKGGNAKPVELYASNKTNIQAAVGRLAAYNNATEDNKFNAIFIADSGPQLTTLMEALSKTTLDISKIKLFGTGLWDDPAITRIPELRGAWFSTSPPDAFQSFELRFKTTYEYQPSRLASLSYDAVSIAVQLTMDDPNGLTDEALTRDEGFEHLANGLVRLRPNGISDRKLAIMEITGDGLKTIDPAPRKYEAGVEPVFPTMDDLRKAKEERDRARKAAAQKEKAEKEQPAEPTETQESQ